MKETLDWFRKSNYFVIIFDSTSGISYMDLMSFIFHCVGVEDKEMEERESFLGFINKQEKTAYDIKKTILDRLEKWKLDFEKCREIRFDNAASMTGVYGGVQSLLRNINGKVKFVPCSYYSLNLCCVYASAVNASIITFFSSSNHQWEVLSSHMKVMMKDLVTIRCRARYEAIRAVKTGFQGVILVLSSLTSI